VQQAFSCSTKRWLPLIGIMQI